MYLGSWSFPSLMPLIRRAWINSGLLIPSAPLKTISLAGMKRRSGDMKRPTRWRRQHTAIFSFTHPDMVSIDVNTAVRTSNDGGDWLAVDIGLAMRRFSRRKTPDKRQKRWQMFGVFFFLFFGHSSRQPKRLLANSLLSQAQSNNHREHSSRGITLSHLSKSLI